MANEPPSVTEPAYPTCTVQATAAPVPIVIKLEPVIEPKNRFTLNTGLVLVVEIVKPPPFCTESTPRFVSTVPVPV